MKKLKQYLMNLRNTYIKFGSNLRKKIGLWLYPQEREVMEIQYTPYNVSHITTSIQYCDHVPRPYIEEQVAYNLAKEIIKNHAIEFRGRDRLQDGSYVLKYVIHVTHPDGGFLD